MINTQKRRNLSTKIWEALDKTGEREEACDDVKKYNFFVIYFNESI